MQNFNFNVSGQRRKELVSAISEILNQPVKYLGMPSAAYEVGSYSIGKAGTVTGEYNLNLFVGLAERGFEPEKSTAFHLVTPRGTLLIQDRFTTEDEASAAGYGHYFDHETDGIWRQVWSKSDENHHTEFAVVGEPFTEPVQETPPEENPEPDRLVIEYPLEGFTQGSLDNLTRMVLAKEPLLKKALSAKELPIHVLDDRICFPWFQLSGDEGEVPVYTQFIAALCETAKEKKRVTAKDPNSGFENERFSMRVWLMGLGLIGTECKAARKLLMCNLSGDSGWRYGKPEAVTPADKSSAEEVPCDELLSQ